MNKRTIILGAAGLLTIGVLAGGGEDSDATTTTTPALPESTTTLPEPEPTREPEPEPTLMTDLELFQVAFPIVWDNLSPSDRSDVCEGIDLAPEFMVDQFREGFGDQYQVSDSDILDAFAEVC